MCERLQLTLILFTSRWNPKVFELQGHTVEVEAEGTQIHPLINRQNPGDSDGDPHYSWRLV